MSFLSVVKLVIFCFVLFTLLISLYFTLWNLCKYFCKYPRMQQYVIFNVLKEYSISKEEEEGKYRGQFEENIDDMSVSVYCRFLFGCLVICRGRMNSSNICDWGTQYIFDHSDLLREFYSRYHFVRIAKQ